MEPAKRNRYYQSAYVEGNNARQFSQAPDYRWNQVPVPEIPERTNPQPKERTANQPQRKPGVSTEIDFLSMLVLLGAMVAVFIVCAAYVRIQAQSIQMDKKIMSLYDEAAKLKDDNDNLEVSLNEPVDLEEVYKIAVGELGMVHANHNQVVSFDNNEFGYVRQYDTVPEASSDRIIDKIIP